MISLQERHRLLVVCPQCFRPLHLAPGARQWAPEPGEVPYDREPLEDAVRLHIRLGCDGP